MRPGSFADHLHRHDVDAAAERGWAALGNGALLHRAEEVGYEVVITADKNIPHQQNLATPKLGIDRSRREPVAPHRAKD